MDEQLLIRFLTQACSAKEVEQIELWIAQDKAHAERFFEIERIWSLKDELRFSDKKELKAAYLQLVSKLKTKEAPTRRARHPFFQWFGYAAALVLLGLLHKQINNHLIKKKAQKTGYA